MAAFAGEGSYKPPMTPYYCTSNPAPKTRYYTGLFDAPASAPIENQNAKAFQQFLSTKYGVNASASCLGNTDKNAAQHQMQQQITQLKSFKWKIVETGWSPSSTQTAAGDTSHPDCNSGDGWKSVAEYKAACENQSQSSASSNQPSSNQAAENSPGQAGVGATANSNSAMAQPSAVGAQAAAASAAGTTLAVRMMEPIDSAKDGPGHQYRGVVTKAASAGSVMIPANSLVAVVLAKDQAGWSAHLNSVIVNRQLIPISSGPAKLTSSAQSMATGAMNSVSSTLSNFGFHKNKQASSVEAVATGNRVVLPPGTQLQFVLNSAAPVVAAYPGAMGNGISNASTPNATVAGASPASAPAPVGNLTAKVTETLLGPSKPLGQSAVSPDGGHYAVLSMHGSREIVIIDGVPGPDFDHAANLNGTSIDVAFSQDGKHSCYIAQRGDQLVEVRDNKEAFVVTTYYKPPIAGNVSILAPVSLHGTPVSNPGHQCLVSDSGAHMAVVSSEVPPSGSGTVWHLFLDGVKSLGFPIIDVNQMAFVGEKLVYVAQTTDQKWHMVVNATPGPGYDKISSLLLSHNDAHYAFIAQNSGGHVVVVDGVAGPPRAHGGNGVHDLTLASNGRCGYIWDKPLGLNGHDGMVQALVVDQKEIADQIQGFATEDTSLSLNSGISILFSPDGKKFAYAKKVAGGIASVIDGKVSRAYDSIGYTGFSPDSAHAFFVGVRQQNFVVVDGQELEGFNRVNGFVWSNQGGRLAFVGWAQDGWHFVVDGKKSPRYYAAMNKTLSFSPDSKHWVYAACTQYMKCAVVVDGNETAVPDVSELSTRSQPRYSFPPIFWSADSSRMAYAHTNADGTNNTLFVINGQAVMHNTGLYEYPDFSPDSKHFATLYWTGHGYALFLDGKTGAPFPDLLEANRNVGRFQNSHEYRFLGIKNGSVYRVTADLGSAN